MTRLLFVQGYHGAAVGKGSQLAKTELEKLKLTELSTREAVYEAARMCVIAHDRAPHSANRRDIDNSIYLVHDDAKDKDFELEVTWIGEESGFQHQQVPKDLLADAEVKAKAAMEEGFES